MHLLTGDLNARTKNGSDLVTFDREIIELLDLDEDTCMRLDIMKNFDLLGLPIERYSSDLTEDNYGRALLELCKNHMLCIFNGRTGADRNIGKLTTNGNSLIDYVIGSPYLLSKVKIFRVHSFDPLFSDYHCLVEWKINSNKSAFKKIRKNSSKHIKSQQSARFWDPNKSANYLQNLDREKISHMIDHFDTYTTNQITNNLKFVLKNSANLSFPKFRPKLNIKKLLGYSKLTNQKRKEYYKAKALHNKRGTRENHNNLIAKSNAARKAVAKDRAISKKKFINKLRNLRDKSPRQYWRLVQGNKKENINISLELLKAHFAELAVEADETDINNLDPEAFIRLLDTTILNKPFTEDEIRKFVKKLKNNKAAGIDEILNEFIKCSIDIMIPLYIKLFNKVLDTGEIPDDWLTGMIIPIYKNKGSKEDANNYRGITLLSCVGKLFTAILNQRLTEFCDNNLILKEIQAGFRKGYSTSDNIYVFKNIRLV